LGCFEKGVNTTKITHVASKFNLKRCLQVSPQTSPMSGKSIFFIASLNAYCQQTWENSQLSLKLLQRKFP